MRQTFTVGAQSVLRLKDGIAKSYLAMKDNGHIGGSPSALMSQLHSTRR